MFKLNNGARKISLLAALVLVLLLATACSGLQDTTDVGQGTSTPSPIHHYLLPPLIKAVLCKWYRRERAVAWPMTGKEESSSFLGAIPGWIPGPGMGKPGISFFLPHFHQLVLARVWPMMPPMTRLCSLAASGRAVTL